MVHHRTRSIGLAIALVACATTCRGEAPPGDGVATAPLPLVPFLNQHCAACHSGETPSGSLDLETYSFDLADAEVRRRWVYLHDRVASGEMPPQSEERPDAAAVEQFLQALGPELTRADAASREVVLRRLNRSEYQNTVRDLFQIYIDLEKVLPDDSAEQGFDTIGSVLSVSAEQMLLYVDAADLVLDEVFGPPQPPDHVDMTVNLKDMISRDTADRIDEDGVVLFSGAKTLPVYGISIRGPAMYRIRFEARAIQSEQPVIMWVDGGVTGLIPGHTAGYFEVPPGETISIELTDRAVERHDTIAFGLVGGFPWWSVGADYQGAGVWIGNIHIEGPLEAWPRPSRTQLLGDVDPAPGSIDDVQNILMRLLPRAFRRAVNPEEVARFVELARQVLDAGQPFETALRRGLKGVLCAPEFLFMEEPLAAETSDTGTPTIDDYALASRLSYFLWSSLPDEELFALAGRGELGQPEVLRAQVERMLTDPKSRRFVENFTDQWLKLRDIDFTVPNVDLYPEYSQLLRRSMLDETHAFFQEILDNNLSVKTFLDSDFAMLNKPLAEFYGIEGVSGLDVHRVPLPADSLRGGVLTQASVLKVSADGTRTSPVLRGAWILENLFGSPSPPPPPSVTAIEPDIRGATTIREQLSKHRSHESCNRCHRKIDPPGFALESFDVIGGQREWYRIAQGGEYVSTPLHPQAPQATVRYQRGSPVDATGTMPDGRAFAGIREYKQLLLADEIAMPQALTRLLLTYALGRNLGFADRPEVDRIVAATNECQYGLRSILHQIVQCPTFRQP